MGISNFYLALAMSWATACGASTIGVVSMNIGGDVRLDSVEKLSRGDLVHFQYPDKTGAPHCCMTLSARRFAPVHSSPTATNALTGEPVFSYKLSGPMRLETKLPFFGMAVIGRALKPRQVSDISLVVDSLTGVFAVDSCTSREGLHVLRKTNAKLVSDLYVGFDYDVENPTCNE